MAVEKYTGLSPQQVEKSREENGENVITPVKKQSVWALFLEKFNDPIIKILLIAAALSMIASFLENEYAETIGIIFAIFLATGVSFWFEYDAKKKFEVLNTVNDDTPVKVIRSGQVTEIPKKEVVVGDIILLESGDEIPADGKLLESLSLYVNESSLTGEIRTKKTTEKEKEPKESTYPLDLLLRGTTVSEGSGIIEVESVGDATEYGKVSQQSTVESKEDTPLNKQLNRLSSLVGKVGATLAVLIFLILFVKGWLYGGLFEGDTLSIFNSILKYFMVSVAVMVMAVPEGLPMSITLSLAMSMRRMLKTNNLVRKMHACETMGAVTVICTDKTGTLTENRMTVSEIKFYTDSAKEIIDSAIAANSTANIGEDKKVIGNPTEGALILWLDSKGVNYHELRNSTEIIDRISFSTERKYMATLVKGDGKNILYIKGAPEIVLDMSEQTPDRQEILDQLRQYQNKAMRTLAFSYAETAATDCETALKESNLQFIAIAGISDPVREEVPDAVRRCLDAGIDIKIITGDTSATARQIAREIGLWDDAIDGECNHITGTDFESRSDEELLEIISCLKVMSRARPLDKQRLVKLLQQQGEVVAVTGDGTNDAPALNFAQVGLSMGSGTSVAKEASDITLLDDSFNSIATAVMWGRSLYKNIQRFVLFQLTVNFVALAVVFFGSIVGNELPLTVTQILWVNLIMDTFAAMALASLPPDPRVMEEKPRKQTDFIITKPMVKWIVGLGSFMIATLLGLLIYWRADAGIYNLTIFFTLFVLYQFWNLFNAKNYGAKYTPNIDFVQTKGFFFILFLIFIGQVAIVTFGGEVFRVVPLKWQDWGYITLFSSLVMISGAVIRKTQRIKTKKAGN